MSNIKNFFVLLFVYCIILPIMYVLIWYDKVTAMWLEWYYTKRGIRFYKRWDKFSYVIMRY